MNRLARMFGLALLLAFASSASAQEWGTIKGNIVWGGAVPEKKTLNLGANPDKAVCEKDGGVEDETWVVNPKNKGLKHAFVWIAVKDAKAKGAAAKLAIHPSLKDVKEKEIHMDQPCCAFVPHAIALREGQVLVAKNASAIGHNYKYTGNPDTANSGNNFLLPPGAQKKIDGLVADRLPIAVECNIHPWMKGWVRVFDHPYYAVTDENGAFEIKDAPVGDFRLLVWHGSGGWRGGAAGRNGEAIAIKSGSNSLGSLEYPPP